MGTPARCMPLPGVSLKDSESNVLAVQWRSMLSFPDCFIHEEDLHCGAEHCVMYDIIYDFNNIIQCHIWYQLYVYDITCDVICISIMLHFACRQASHHLWSNQVAKQERKVQEQDTNPIASKMLPCVPANIHIVEMGGIFRGHFKERCRRIQRG